MSQCNDEEEEEESEDCDTQADRVGNDDPNDEDADRDGPDDDGDSNCWGKVTSELAEDGGIGGIQVIQCQVTWITKLQEKVLGIR